MQCSPRRVGLQQIAGVALKARANASILALIRPEERYSRRPDRSPASIRSLETSRRRWGGCQRCGSRAARGCRVVQEAIDGIVEGHVWEDWARPWRRRRGGRRQRAARARRAAPDQPSTRDPRCARALHCSSSPAPTVQNHALQPVSRARHEEPQVNREHPAAQGGRTCRSVKDGAIQGSLLPILHSGPAAPVRAPQLTSTALRPDNRRVPHRGSNGRDRPRRLLAKYLYARVLQAGTRPEGARTPEEERRPHREAMVQLGIIDSVQLAKGSRSSGVPFVNLSKGTIPRRPSPCWPGTCAGTRRGPGQGSPEGLVVARASRSTLHAGQPAVRAESPGVLALATPTTSRPLSRATTAKAPAAASSRPRAAAPRRRPCLGRGDDAPVIRLVEKLISEAVNTRRPTYT